MSDEKQAQGIQLDKLIKWNRFLAGIRVDEKPLTPFANQLAFLRCKEAEVLYGGGTRGGIGLRNNLFSPQNPWLFLSRLFNTSIFLRITQ